MWAARYFPSRYWPTRYWPKVPRTIASCGCDPYDDGSTYGDGELYCSSDNIRTSYIIAQDIVCHFLSFRLTATGTVILDAIRPIISRLKVKPFQYQVDVDKDNIKRCSFRITGTGCLELTSIRPNVAFTKQQPIL